jgi:quinol monooxygenase YgiN
MSLIIFARFHASAGHEDRVAAGIAETAAASGQEADCLGIEVYRSIDDPQLFYVHSKWTSIATFESHGRSPHSQRLVEQVLPLLDRPLDVTRAQSL